MAEILLKSGTIIDGTGDPSRVADLLISGGRIKAIGTGLSTKGQTIDVAGLAVTPGLIDPHTHLDGQFFFEPTGSPSAWHAVTTVLMGHCGYSLAPIKKEHLDYIIHMFAAVEEIPPRLLEQHIPWSWESFPQYLDRLEHNLGINVISQVGHSTLRYYVMGDDATKRHATESELDQMRRLLREALRAGAFGFTTSRSPTHVGWDGSPVPSRYASPEEIVSLAEELAVTRLGTLGYIPEGTLAGLTPQDKAIIIQMAHRSGGKSVQLNGVSNKGGLQFMEDASKQGAKLYGVNTAQPFYRYFDFQEGTVTFNSMDTWFAVMNKAWPERRAALASRDLRPTLRREADAEATMEGKSMRRARLNWAEMRVVTIPGQGTKQYESWSIQEIAAKQGKHVVDALLDLAEADDWKTRFIYRVTPESSWLSNARGEEYKHPNLIPMNSDSGAHLGSECKAGEGIFFLRHWVLNLGVMRIEEGIRRVTADVARHIGLPDRGLLREGFAADIAVFDLERLDALPKEQAWDLPQGSMRWIQRATGIQHVFVNGEQTIESGKHTGRLPGGVLRSSRYA